MHGDKVDTVTSYLYVAHISQTKAEEVKQSFTGCQFTATRTEEGGKRRKKNNSVVSRQELT